jgi:hypothetical protein
MPSTVKAKNDIFLVVDGNMKVRSLLMWLFFMQICLFASNVHYGPLFIFMHVMLLCFRWAHFWWCGCVCTSVLMDVNQGFASEYEDKTRSY